MGGGSSILQVDSASGTVVKDRLRLFDIAWRVNDGFQRHVGARWAAPAGGTHHYAHVKGVHRVYQKVNRAYKGRLARVLDVVRTTVTFDDLEALADCLEAIGRDPAVSVLRVKNRYSPAYDSLDGYRDVSLLVVGAEVTGGFVCEVQLNLSAMYAAKSSGGHRRYILARDARGD